MKPIRDLLVVFLLGTSLSLSGCLSYLVGSEFSSYCAENPTATQCENQIPASVRYYAALGDYNRVKALAVAFAESQSTTSEQIAPMLMAMEEADLVVRDVEMARQHNTPIAYTAAVEVLRKVNEYLRRQLPADAATGVTP